jgi:hypothetical protein
MTLQKEIKLTFVVMPIELLDRRYMDQCTLSRLPADL